MENSDDDEIDEDDRDDGNSGDDVDGGDCEDGGDDGNDVDYGGGWNDTDTDNVDDPDLVKSFGSNGIRI